MGDLKELFELGPEFNSDLPVDGEIDIVDDTPQKSEQGDDGTLKNRNTPSPANSGSGTRDRRVLEALFNGDAVAGVYDHNYFESSDSTCERDRTVGGRQDARHHVDEVMRRMSKPPVASKFGQYASSSAPSSSMILSNLRALNTDVSTTAENTGSAISEAEVATSTSVLRDLKSMFELPGSSFTTQEIVNHFSDLSDDIAPIFREMLRRVAKFKEGVWTRNREFFS